VQTNKLLAIKWQYLAILIIGIVLGVVLAVYWSRSRVEAKLVTIESRGISFEAVSFAGIVSEVLAEQGFSIENAMVLPGPEEPVQSGMTIYYRKPVSVTVADSGRTSQVAVTAMTVGQALSELGVRLNPADIVSPGLDEQILDGSTISIERIEKVKVTEAQEIAYTKDVQGDPNTLYGVEELIRQGAPGLKDVVYEVTYKDGEEVSRRKLSETVTRQPVNAILRVGRKIEVEAYEQGRASWYAYKGCLCAAHPYFPKGSYIRATNLANGKSVIVRVNDWGPDQSVHPDRVLDLDSVAFKQLAPLSLGMIEIKAEKLVSPD